MTIQNCSWEVKGWLNKQHRHIHWLIYDILSLKSNIFSVWETCPIIPLFILIIIRSHTTSINLLNASFEATVSKGSDLSSISVTEINHWHWFSEPWYCWVKKYFFKERVKPKTEKKTFEHLYLSCKLQF